MENGGISAMVTRNGHSFGTIQMLSMVSWIFARF